MAIRVVLQARLSSSRLPAKVLLPIAGVPLAVLCAERIKRSGLQLILATSNESSDDLLVSVAEKNHIPVFRGSLNNVLQRYVAATSDLKDDDIVVRVTADNPVVDADFIQAMIDRFESANLDYLGTHSPLDKLPYGLSAEVMTVAALRSAHAQATTQFEREHVTHWIKTHLSAKVFDGLSVTENRDLSFLRCTIDSLHEYQLMAGLFNTADIDAVHSSWTELIEKLQQMPSMPAFNIPYQVNDGAAHSVLALGTVQLGVDYGIANEQGMYSSTAATEIIHQAIQLGCNWIDTARGYGISEQRVGAALAGGWASRTRLVTKLDPLNSLPETPSAECVEKAVENSIFTSLHALQMRQLDVLLLHRWSHRTAYQGGIWNKLLSLRDQGIIGQLGVSVYDPSEAIEALADRDIAHIQLPFNLFDQRWLAVDIQQALADRPDVRIHVRSAFLQGLLISDEAVWPEWCQQSAQWVDRIQQLVKQLQRKSRADFCLAYIRSFAWVDAIVVGVETGPQLLDNFKLSLQPPLSKKECIQVQEVFRDIPERLINPSQW